MKPLVRVRTIDTDVMTVVAITMDLVDGRDAWVNRAGPNDISLLDAERKDLRNASRLVSTSHCYD